MMLKNWQLLAKTHPLWAAFFALEFVFVAVFMLPLLGFLGAVFVGAAMTGMCFLGLMLICAAWTI